MRLLRLLALVLMTLLVSPAFAGSITGVFQGAVVQLQDAPTARNSQARGKTGPRWMYVQGKNGVIRRANIARAKFEYDEDFPRDKRHKRPEESLLKAAVVRVTAEKDTAKDGEWQAVNVLIVSPPGFVRPRTKPSLVNPTLARR